MFVLSQLIFDVSITTPSSLFSISSTMNCASDLFLKICGNKAKLRMTVTAFKELKRAKAPLTLLEVSAAFR